MQKRRRLKLIDLLAVQDRLFVSSSAIDGASVNLMYDSHFLGINCGATFSDFRVENFKRTR